MDKIIIYGVMVILICSILLYLSFNEGSTFKKRKIQSHNLLKENIIRKKLDELTKKKVKISKRIKIEKTCIQAGYDIQYVDYLIICIVTTLAISGIFKFLLSNTYLGIVFLVVGGFLPYQYILFNSNKRIDKMDGQVGPFLKMIIDRYKTSKDMKRTIEATAAEFKNEQPLSREIDRMVIQMSLGKTVEDALSEFADRVENKYLIRFVDYYKICTEIGTIEVRDMLDEALKQYREDRKNKLFLKREISSVKSDSYIVLAGVPLVAIYSALTNPDYLPFMTQTTIGQIGTAVVVCITLAEFWFINKKIGAPIK